MERLGGKHPQSHFLPFFPQFPSHIFICVLGKNTFSTTTLNPINSSLQMNQKDFLMRGAEGRKASALWSALPPAVCSLLFVFPERCSNARSSARLLSPPSFYLPLCKSKSRRGCGLAPAWLRCGIWGDFYFLLLLLCVFAIKALAPFADAPSVLPYVCHRDMQRSRA